jgi:hypothetical protein
MAAPCGQCRAPARGKAHGGIQLLCVLALCNVRVCTVLRGGPVASPGRASPPALCRACRALHRARGKTARAVGGGWRRAGFRHLIAVRAACRAAGAAGTCGGWGDCRCATIAGVCARVCLHTCLDYHRSPSLHRPESTVARQWRAERCLASRVWRPANVRGVQGPGPHGAFRTPRTLPDATHRVGRRGVSRMPRPGRHTQWLTPRTFPDATHFAGHPILWTPRTLPDTTHVGRRHAPDATHPGGRHGVTPRTPRTLADATHPKPRGFGGVLRSHVSKSFVSWEFKNCPRRLGL